MHTRSVLGALSAVILTLFATACSSSTETHAPATQAVTSGSGGTASEPSTSTPPPCPNPEGEACLGPLTAKTTYTTTVFATPITYSVPAAGWFNYEDTTGNFLLVPPGNDLAGVNGGTSDFLGVYRAIAAASFDRLPPLLEWPNTTIASG